MKSLDIYFGLNKRVKQVPRELHNESFGFDIIEERWVGRSCGCDFSNEVSDELPNPKGIAIYPGHTVNTPLKKSDVVSLVTTKNGPITVVCGVKHYREN